MELNAGGARGFSRRRASTSHGSGFSGVFERALSSTSAPSVLAAITADDGLASSSGNAEEGFPLSSREGEDPPATFTSKTCQQRGPRAGGRARRLVVGACCYKINAKRQQTRRA